MNRVLSLIVNLRCISSLSFIPLSPSNLRPFRAPPSIGRRECPREPLPLEGAAEHSEAGLASFFAALGCSRIMAHLRRSPPLFHTARTLSGSLRSPPSPHGEGFIRRYSFSTHACIRFDDARKPAFSYRSLPHWGRGTALAVDRVLSLIVDLRCISSLSFIPLSPSNLRPFGAPPSIGRRQCPREPLPLEGAAKRSEAGLASFFAAKPPPLSLPHWGRGTASAVDRVLS